MRILRRRDVVLGHHIFWESVIVEEDDVDITTLLDYLLH